MSISNEFSAVAGFYIPPDPVFARVKVSEFTGRAWLTAIVDRFLRDPQHRSGVFILSGVAGVGKTAFMAHLVRERGYLHLFAEQVPGGANVARALQSLGAQLAARYHLQEYANPDALLHLASSPQALERLLRHAAGRLGEGRQIVIVCDALDEMGIGPNGNVAGLPSMLPDGVYLVLSQRPVPLPLHFENVIPHVEILSPDSDVNGRDMEAYLLAMADRASIAQQLRQSGYTAAEFAGLIRSRSGGNWMYLQYLLKEIEAGERRSLDPVSLPSGLAAYYAEYWERWRSGQQGGSHVSWETVCAPLLATLAAAQEPRTLLELLEWLEFPDSLSPEAIEVRRLLSEAWSAFINVLDRDGATRYAIYHASLRDFVEARVIPEDLPQDACALMLDLRRHTREAHARIVASMRMRCGGSWVQLVGEEYLRVHLVTHLAGAGENETMFGLVAAGKDWAEARYGAEESYAGYLMDLARAWAWAESGDAWHLGRQIHCGLVQSSLRSLAGQIRPELLAQLVESGLWSAARGLEHIPLISPASQRAHALTVLTPHLPESLKGEALTIARAIDDEFVRKYALSDMFAHLPPALQAGAIAAARALPSPHARMLALCDFLAYVPAADQAPLARESFAVLSIGEYDRWSVGQLRELLPYLPADLVAEAWAVARETRDAVARASALCGLLAFRPDAGSVADVEEVWNAIQAVDAPSKRIQALRDLLPYLPEPRHTQVIEQFLLEARSIADTFDRQSALRDLVKILSDPLRAEVAQEGMALARTEESISARCRSIQWWAQFLPAAMQEPARREAFAAALSMPDDLDRARALQSFVAELPADLKPEALAAARNIQSPLYRAQALNEVSKHLSPELREEVLQKALDSARTIVNNNWRAKALSELAPELPGALKLEALQEALSASRTIADAWAQVDALKQMAELLPEPWKETALRDALQIISRMEDTNQSISALRRLTPKLPDALRPEALRLARAIPEPGRLHALAHLIEYLPEPIRSDILAEVLINTSRLPDPASRIVIYGDVASCLPIVNRVAIVREVLSFLPSVADGPNGRWIFKGFLPALPAELQDYALAMALKIKGIKTRAEILAQLAAHESEAFKAEAAMAARTAARALHDLSDRAYVLTEVVAHLTGTLKAEVADEALTCLDAVIRRDSNDGGWTLHGLAEHLNEAQSRSALPVARRVRFESRQVEILIRLAANLPGADHDATVAEALQLATSIKDAKNRSKALRHVLPHLPEAVKTHVLAEALQAARLINNKDSRAPELVRLLPYLADDLKREVIPEALLTAAQAENEEPFERSSELARLVSFWQALPGAETNEMRALWPKILHALAGHRRSETLRDLAGLAPLVVSTDSMQTLIGIYRSISEVCSWWP